ncbi:MAG: class I SAM-dependent methyltransferase [Oscillospiraceae bacterium]|nr:class I SAM-dependent methyltransferase [Oscillospiraceae bacterium]
MYSDVFCKVYNEFGWNYYPEIFGEQLLTWIKRNNVNVKTSLDLACGTGVLCEIMHGYGAIARGMDFSSGMIDIARSRNGDIHYDVADMTVYCPDEKFDIVTCTGDAINHISEISDIEKIFKNVYAYTAEGGYFIFDLLNENEVSDSEPFEMDFTDTMKVWFQMTRPADNKVNLCIRVFEEGKEPFEENIRETIHDPAEICALLKKCGFSSVTCRDRLLDDAENHSTTWFVVASK